MSEWISFCLKSFGLILSAVTTVFTVLLWGSLPEDVWSSLLMGAAGFALEGSKFLLLLLALLFFRQKQFLASVTGGFLALLLFVVSIGASVGFLEKSEQQQKRSSQTWNNSQKSVSQIDAEIETLLLSSRTDIENGYRERGLKTREEIANLRSFRKTLQETPETLPAETSFGGLASMVGMDNQKIRLYAWLLLAILIDGVAAACWVFLAMLPEAGIVSKAVPETQEPQGGERKTARVTESMQAREEHPETSPEPLPETVRKESENKEENSGYRENISEYREKKSEMVFDCKASEKTPVILKASDQLYEQVRQKIQEDQEGYDSSLTLNRLMKLESIGYTKARRIMDRLENG